MIKLCIINKNTYECLDVQYVQSVSDWTDTEDLIVCDSNEGEIGQFWNGNGWMTYEEWCEKHRQRRNKYLTIHIDTMNAIRWNSLTQDQKDDWVQYREDLLNLPQQSDFPRIINWPTKPE